MIVKLKILEDFNVPTWVYKPDHPYANENGFVEKGEYLQSEYNKTAHLGMTKGNKRVTMNFISDSMEPLQHMASGKMISSKKKFRDETKAYGCVEVGTETKALLKPRTPVKLDKRQRREGIKQAIHELKNGVRPNSH